MSGLGWGEGPVQSKAGVLRTELGTLALGFGESLREIEVPSGQWEKPRNPDILPMGRMK